MLKLPLSEWGIVLSNSSANDVGSVEGITSIFVWRCLLKTSNHAGVEGYIIKNIKDQIHLSVTVSLLPLETIFLLKIVSELSWENMYNLGFEQCI